MILPLFSQKQTTNQVYWWGCLHLWVLPIYRNICFYIHLRIKITDKIIFDRNGGWWICYWYEYSVMRTVDLISYRGHSGICCNFFKSVSTSHFRFMHEHFFSVSWLGSQIHQHVSGLWHKTNCFSVVPSTCETSRPIQRSAIEEHV